MKMILPGQPHHVYQRSSDRGLLFYTAADVLTYFTIYMTYARLFEITVLGVCPMRDHVHGMIIPPSKEMMAKFEGATNRAYAVEFNVDTGTKGPVFEHSYSFAARKDLKRIRSSIIYLYNNPVEKHLCDKVIDARWNFLAYGFSTNPFSEPLIIRKASRAMRRSIEEVKYMRAQNKYLNQRIIHRMFKSLDTRERAQLADYIVVTYSAINYKKLFSYWKTPEIMLLAMDSTTGAEYDIGEKVNKALSDKAYSTIAHFLEKDYGYKRAKDVLILPERNRMNLLTELIIHTDVNEYQIKKFLHLDTGL